jgi:stage V sporulation protein G
MNVTNLKIRKVERKNILVGFAEVDSCLVIHGIRILEGKNGYFIGMPNKKNKKDKYLDIVHPSNTEFRNKLTKIIIDEFNKKGAEAINEN